VTGRADRWIRWTTIICVALLALIAGPVSYLHMHRLVALHRQPGWGLSGMGSWQIDPGRGTLSVPFLIEERMPENA
jgi:hypothetical protein